MARLISWLLNVVYLAIIAVASPLIVWQALRTGKYREGFREKLLGLWCRDAMADATCVWIHAVSVGEVNLLATLLRELRAAHPDWQFVVSTTSRTGYELARKKYADLSVFYCPLDFSWAVAQRDAAQFGPTMLGARRIGTLAESDHGREGSTALASRSSTAGSATTASPATAASARLSPACCGKSISSPPKTKSRPTASGTRRAAGSRPRHRLAQIRRRSNRSQQRTHASTARTRRHRGRRHRLPRRQHARTGRTDRDRYLPPTGARASTTCGSSSSLATRNASTPSPQTLDASGLPWHPPLAILGP